MSQNTSIKPDRLLITAIGATRISTVTRRDSAGDRAITNTHVLEQDGGRRRARQVAAIHGDRLCTVSLTAAAEEFDNAERQFAQMLTSWRWR